MAKSNKKRKKSKGGKQALTILIVLLLIAAIVGGYILWEKGYLDKYLDFGGKDSVSSGDSSNNSGSSDSENSSSNSGNSSGGAEDIVTDELSIHFLELGNKYTGDCTLIKAGDTEILIDAGSRQNSAAAIVPYVREYCTDGVLEYVIATHAHQDHIAGFVGTKAAPGIFESFVCGTVIDFALTNASSSIYQNYVAKRDAEVEAGAAHYTALQCWNETDGAKRSYEIADGITMNILYNVFYETNSGDENNYSVCLLLTQGNNHYLFTGDLEKEGEAALVKNNSLPKCRLFKGGHHGSYTANTKELMAVIQPEIVCVCCCCGSDEYKAAPENLFPSQAFVDNVSVYTDKIYVTTLANDSAAGYESMNGNIVVTSDGGKVNVKCSHNDTLFKDTDWFKKNRTLPEGAMGAA